MVFKNVYLKIACIYCCLLVAMTSSAQKHPNVKVINKQEFSEGTVPQTLLAEPFPAKHRKKIVRKAYYLGQTRYLYSTLYNTNNKFLRIFNDGKKQSSKVYVYNPYGALSTTDKQAAPNSFIPDFGFKSNLLPKNVAKVYVAYQNQPTHIAGTAPYREQPAAEVVYEMWRRLPETITTYDPWEYDPDAFDYSYLEYDGKGGKAKTIRALTTYSNNMPRTNNDGFVGVEIYVARCGDGVVDNVNNAAMDMTYNGVKGIYIEKEGVLAEWSIPDNELINEQCDNGNQNSDTEKGACKTDCSGYIE